VGHFEIEVDRARPAGQLLAQDRQVCLPAVPAERRALDRREQLQLHEFRDPPGDCPDTTADFFGEVCPTLVGEGLAFQERPRADEGDFLQDALPVPPAEGLLDVVRQGADFPRGQLTGGTPAGGLDGGLADPTLLFVLALGVLSH